ncbi:MAG: oligopeptide transporter, OPT family [Acidobacteria bacterium]|nr:oligopeptide transporter, OPT family [Acidobacteriota bacterium]
MTAPPRGPYIDASTSLPEITVKAAVLGALLSMVLGAANAYLGLFAGLTVSASIPAAVVSMAVLRLFRRSNILENNIVQTAASAGESLAAGIIFTVPALVILGAWQEFQYWDVTIVGALGGIIGVMFTIPLRRALVVESPLTFPEGVATAEVLITGDRGGAGVTYLAAAGAAGALFKLGASGLRVWSELFEWARFAGGSLVYVGVNLSPALVGVGFIVGLHVATLVFLGGVLNWWVAIPLVVASSGLPPGVESAADAAGVIWSTRTRYIGVGAMIIGGIWTLGKVRRSIVDGIRSGLEVYRRTRAGGVTTIPRTERDAPMPWVGAAVAASAVPLYVVFEAAVGSHAVALAMAGLMLVAGFLFSAVAGYMAGLVGSSNNPLSGVTIATVLSSALLLSLLGTGSAVGPAAAILIGAVVACAGAIAGDNLQDLKAGQIVGATPFRQQIMQVVGVCAASVVMAPVLTLLMTAYGIGVPTAAHPAPLAAPQATLMAAVAGGVFGGGLPWDMVGWGAALGAGIILLDVWLERRGAAFRTPVLAVAVGIYLPLELSTAIFLGGLVAFAAARTRARRRADPDAPDAQHGLLFAAGLITGEALVGILLAVPIVVAGRADVLSIFGTFDSALPGVVLLCLVMYLLFRAASGRAVRA